LRHHFVRFFFTVRVTSFKWEAAQKQKRAGDEIAGAFLIFLELLLTVRPSSGRLRDLPEGSSEGSL
jgi:hypothetical protein